MSRVHGIKEKDLIDFSANINPYPPRKIITRGILKSLSSVYSYPDRHYSLLHEELSHWLDIEPGSLILGNGAVDLLYLLGKLLKPRKVMIISPTFGEYEKAFARGEIFFHHLDPLNPEINVETLTKTLTDDFDLLVLCNPSNPLGCFYSLSLVKELVAITAKKKIVFFVDEAFIEFIPSYRSQSVMNLINLYPHLIVLRSLTKYFAIPGLRLGFLVSGDLDLIARGREHQPPWQINSLAAEAVPYYLKHLSAFEKGINRMRRERKRFIHSLEKLPFFILLPTSVNFLLIKLNAPLNGDVLHKRFITKHNILIRTSLCGLDSSYIRIAVKDKKSNTLLIQAFKNELSSFF